MPGPARRTSLVAMAKAAKNRPLLVVVTPPKNNDRKAPLRLKIRRADPLNDCFQRHKNNTCKWLAVNPVELAGMQSCHIRDGVALVRPSEYLRAGRCFFSQGLWCRFRLLRTCFMSDFLIKISYPGMFEDFLFWIISNNFFNSASFCAVFR